MYRLTIILGVFVVVFVYATIVQSFRLWEVQGEAAALRIAVAKKQEEARKVETERERGVGYQDDDFWKPASSKSPNGGEGETVTGGTPEKGVGAASDGDGPDKVSGPSLGPGKKGASCKRSLGTAEGASADGLAAITGTDGKSAGGGGKTAASTNAKGKSKGGKSGDGKAADGKSALASDPARAEDLVRSAQQLIKDGNFDQARSILQESLQADPKNTNAWRNLASVERQVGNSEGELSAYKQWNEARPDEKIARYLAAEAYARNGIDDQALQYLADFQAMSRDDPQSNAMTASIYQQMNMTAEQGDALRQWVAASPASPDAHRVLGDYYQQVGQPDLALAEYQRMAAIQPNSPTPYVQLGNAYIQMGQPDVALSQFETAVSIRPNNVEALGRLAYTQRQLGDMQGAVANYQRIISLEPGSTAGAQAVRNIQSIQAELSVQSQQQAAQR